MDTLWSFVDAAWLNDSSLVARDFQRKVYSKPGINKDNFELRRITTAKAEGLNRSFDFFEYYWAHMMPGNSPSDIAGWLKDLFWRWPSSLPRTYWSYWVFGWILTIGGVIAWLYWNICSGADLLQASLWVFIPPIVGLLMRLIVPVAGDAARYFRAEPTNIEARQRIRAEGIALVDRITASGDYDRIVMVGTV